MKNFIILFALIGIISSFPVTILDTTEPGLKPFVLGMAGGLFAIIIALTLFS